MAGRAVRALLLTVALVLGGSPAAAASVVPGAGESSACVKCPTTASGGEGTITVARGRSDYVPGRGSPTQGDRGDGGDYSYVREYATPTCSGNRLNGDDALCLAALTSCPAAGQVRFWIWHQRVDVKAGPPKVVTTGPWVDEEGSYCLGPDDPGVPDIVRTLAAAQQAFEQRVRQIAPPTIRTVPGPRTLVQWPTRFTAQGAEPFSDDVTVLGATVRLHVQPESFRWVFGDGTTAQTAGPTTTHTYPVKGRRVIRVDVVWGGWFTVDQGTERFPIDPPATSTGRPGLVTAVEARAENLA